MGRASRITTEQREESWRRYKAGESVLGFMGALRLRGSVLTVYGAAPALRVPQKGCCASEKLLPGRSWIEHDRAL